VDPQLGPRSGVQALRGAGEHEVSELNQREQPQRHGDER
jgi:hypothetical protein